MHGIHKFIVSFIQDRALSFLLLAVWLIYIVEINIHGLWGHAGVPHISPLFADLGAILNASDCDMRGFDVYTLNACTNVGGIHVYGRAWLLLNKIGIGPQHQHALGIAVDITFMVLSVWLVKPKSIVEFLICCLIFFSPAVSLALERSNNDLVIFIFIFISIALLARNSRLLRALGLVLIYFSAMLKIYPGILFFAALFVQKSRLKEALVPIAITLLLASLWVATSFSEILLIKNIMPTPVGYYTTGGNQLFGYLGLGQSKFLSVIFVLIIGIGSTYLSRRIHLSDLPARTSTISYIAFVFGLFLLFFTYIVNTNYDYRWVFLIFILPYLFETLRCAVRPSLTFRLTALSFLCGAYLMWSEALMGNHPFALKNLYIALHLGRFLIPLEWVQRCLKEASAWVLFAILFSFIIKALGNRSQRAVEA